MNEIKEIIMKIKSYNKITDVFILYNIDKKIFVIRDKLNNLPIRHFSNFTVEKFNEFMSELSKISLWNSDYNFDMKIIKY